MSEKFDKFSQELDALIVDGERLHYAMQYECYGDEFIEMIVESLGQKDATKALNELPAFRSKYQTWYSVAQGLVKQVLPDRLADFKSYYEYTKVRKDITYENYMIRDYLQRLESSLGGRKLADGKSAIPEFVQQLNIVKAAKESLDSLLIDLTIILQADLFDSEIESAAALSKAGHLRAAGALCGVVIEKHLLQVCDAHVIVIKKKRPGISDLIQLLKDSNVLSVQQWRYIQHLADIRNLCDHAKSAEPKKEEIEDLVAGTKKILKTIF